MSDLIQISTNPIAPIYAQARPNEPIELGRVAVQFNHRGAEYRGIADVAMRFASEDRLEFVCPLAGKSLSLGYGLLGDAEWDGKLSLTERGITLDVLCVAIGGDQDQIVFLPKRSPISVMPPSNDIS